MVLLTVMMTVTVLQLLGVLCRTYASTRISFGE